MRRTTKLSTNNNAINPYSNDANNPSSNDLDNKNSKINDKLNDVYGSDNNDNDKVRFAPETIDVKITLSENVYQVARLICQMEYDLDWDKYVSALVRQDAFSIKNGDRQIFKEYVDKLLENEDPNADYNLQDY